MHSRYGFREAGCAGITRLILWKEVETYLFSTNWNSGLKIFFAALKTFRFTLSSGIPTLRRPWMDLSMVAFGAKEGE